MSASSENIREYLSGIFPREFKANANGFRHDRMLYKYSDIITEHMGKDQLAEHGIPDEEMIDFFTLDERKRKNFLIDAFNKIQRERLQELRNNFAEENDEMFEVEFDPMNFILLNDLKTDNTLVYSRPQEEVTDIHMNSLLSLCTADERSALMDNITPCRFTYDPYKLTPFEKINNGHYEFVRVNLYKAPEWLKDIKDSIDTPATLPEIIQEFLDHLIPDQKAQIYLFNWLHNCLTLRNETYLVLNGKKGAGKGLLVDLAKMLVGTENYAIAPESLLSKEFNAVLDRKRLINYDEQKIAKKEHTRLKRYINKHQNIEKKGIDADKAEETFNSYIITNNDVTDMYLETDDRRFSVLDMTEVPLKKIWSMKKIKQFNDLIESDEEFAQEFGKYIYQYRDQSFDVHSPFIGPTFFNLCYYSLKPWQRYIVDKITAGDKEQWTLRELRRGVTEDAGLVGGNKYFPTNAEKVNDFLKDYLHHGKDELGKLVKDEDGVWMIEVNPVYLGEEVEYDYQEDEAEQAAEELL